MIPRGKGGSNAQRPAVVGEPGAGERRAAAGVPGRVTVGRGGRVASSGAVAGALPEAVAAGAVVANVALGTISGGVAVALAGWNGAQAASTSSAASARVPTRPP